MGIYIYPDFFLDKISIVFQYMEHIRMYTYDMVIVASDMYKHHMYILDIVLK